MAQTIVQICGLNGERKFYGYEANGKNALGATDEVSNIIIGGEHYCHVHKERHPSTEVVVAVPFEGSDFNDLDGKFDSNWATRFKALASKKADNIIFQAPQTG